MSRSRSKSRSGQQPKSIRARKHSVRLQLANGIRITPQVIVCDPCSVSSALQVLESTQMMSTGRTASCYAANLPGSWRNGDAHTHRERECTCCHRIYLCGLFRPREEAQEVLKGNGSAPSSWCCD
jgi:hypothetical protein